MEKFPKESFIDTVEAASNTGGNTLNDIITLKNGMVIRISAELITIYKDEESDESSSNPIAVADMVEIDETQRDIDPSEVDASDNALRFFWKDETGRGYTSHMSLVEVLGQENTYSNNGDKLHYWAVNASAGGEWQGRTDKYICLEDAPK